MASLGASTGLSRRPVMLFSASSSCVAKSLLVAISTVPFARRSGSSSPFKSKRAGNKERTSLSGSTSSSVVNWRPYSLASHWSTSASDRTVAPPCRVNERASLAESCLSATIFASNSLVGETFVSMALMATRGSCRLGELLYQTHGESDGFLGGIENFLQFILGGRELGFLLLLLGAHLGHGGLQFFLGRLRLDRFFERLVSRAGFATEIATIATALIGIVVIATGTTHHSAHAAAGTDFAARFSYFRHALFNNLPLGVIFDGHLFADVFHHTLLHLGRVEIAATGSTTALTALAILPAASRRRIILRREIAYAQHQGRAEARHCQ